jgi:hypothetical protein
LYLDVLGMKFLCLFSPAVKDPLRVTKRAAGYPAAECKIRSGPPPRSAA